MAMETQAWLRARDASHRQQSATACGQVTSRLVRRVFSFAFFPLFPPHISFTNTPSFQLDRTPWLKSRISQLRSRTSFLRTTLAFATLPASHSPTADIPIESDYPIKPDDKHEHSIDLAIYRGDETAVRMLLNAGASLDHEARGFCDCLNFTSLYISEPLGKHEGLRYYPLHLAFYRGHSSIAIQLLDRGSPAEIGMFRTGDPSTRHNQPPTALHAALAAGMEDVVAYILQQGLVEPTAPDFRLALLLTTSHCRQSECR